MVLGEQGRAERFILPGTESSPGFTNAQIDSAFHARFSFPPGSVLEAIRLFVELIEQYKELKGESLV